MSLKHSTSTPLVKTNRFSLNQVIPGCYYVSYKSRITLGYAFCRMQEHYESPKYAGKVFSNEEFRVWWKKNFGGGKFNYPHKFSGYNFPSSNLLKFKEGAFAPHTRLEAELLGAINKIPDEKFYLIGGTVGDAQVLDHELAHAMFYLNREYRDKVLAILARYIDIHPYFHACLKDIGYCQAVYLDEINAFLSTDSPDGLGSHHPQKKPLPPEAFLLASEVQSLFKDYLSRAVA